jgi:hypothetical protein
MKYSSKVFQARASAIKKAFIMDEVAIRQQLDWIGKHGLYRLFISINIFELNYHLQKNTNN